MVRIIDIKPGDELLGWMKLGYGLRKERNVATGQLYRIVEPKAVRFSYDDLSRWTGWVVSNDVANRVLYVETQAMNRYTMASGDKIFSQVPYLAIKQLRRLSKMTFPGKPQNPLRPTQVAIGSQNRPYRTIEEVLLTWT